MFSSNFVRVFQIEFLKEKLFFIGTFATNDNRSTEPTSFFKLSSKVKTEIKIEKENKRTAQTNNVMRCSNWEKRLRLFRAFEEACDRSLLIWSYLQLSRSLLRCWLKNNLLEGNQSCHVNSILFQIDKRLLMIQQKVNSRFSN